jgi:hypothetical protein
MINTMITSILRRITEETIEEIENEEITEQIENEDIDDKELDKVINESINDIFYKKNIIRDDLVKFKQYVKIKKLTSLKLNSVKYKNILLMNVLIKNTQQNLYNRFKM